jgi:hypothetical protein
MQPARVGRLGESLTTVRSLLNPSGGVLAIKAGDNMNYPTLSDLLLWCAVLNYLVLLLWFAAFCLAHEWMFRLHGRWFRLTAAQFDSLHYGGMAAYKIGILLLNLVPYIALRIITHHAG